MLVLFFLAYDKQESILFRKLNFLCVENTSMFFPLKLLQPPVKISARILVPNFYLSVSVLLFSPRIESKYLKGSVLLSSEYLQKCC